MSSGNPAAPRAVLGAILVGVQLLIGPTLAGSSLASQSNVSSTSDGALTVYGEADYSWTIRGLDGAPFDLGEHRGEVLFINLWASWCTPCVREMASIEGLQDRLADTDIRFLIVAADRERPIRRHLRRYPTDLPIYMEVERIPQAFGMRGLPTSWLVDRQGRIVLLRHGEAVWDTDEVEAFARSVLGS